MHIQEVSNLKVYDTRYVQKKNIFLKKEEKRQLPVKNAAVNLLKVMADNKQC